MAVRDLRTLEERNRGGSDLLAFGLTDEQMEEATGVTDDDGGWILVSFLAPEGGQMGPDRDTSVWHSEGGTRDESEDRDEFIITGRFAQSSDTTLKLVKWLENNHVPVRRALPVRETDDGDPLHQLWYFPKAKLDKTNWRMSTARESDREIPFTLRAEKVDPDDPTDTAYVFATVNLSEEAEWPAILDDAKDAVFPGA